MVTGHVTKFDLGSPFAQVAAEDFGGNVDRDVFETVLAFLGLFLIGFFVVL